MEPVSQLGGRAPVWWRAAEPCHAEVPAEPAVPAGSAP